MTIPVPTERAREDRGLGRWGQVLTGLATLTKGESRSDLGSSIVDKIANHLDIVTGHDHLLGSVSGTFWPFEGNGNISCAQEELRTIVFHERSVSTTLLLGEDLGVRNVRTTGIIISVENVEVCSRRSEPGTF